MARHWTPETDKEAERLYRTFPERKIRHYQDLVQQQLRLAYIEHVERGRDMSDAVADLQAMDDALAREMLRRC